MTTVRRSSGSSEFNDEKTNNNSTSGTDSSATTWRKVGDSIIYNEEVIGVGSAGTYVFRGYVRHTSSRDTRSQSNASLDLRERKDENWSDWSNAKSN